MRSTGIIRRIDELGRIVIPRAIRSTCNIQEGDAMEIFVDQDTVTLKPYCPEGLTFNHIKSKWQSMTIDERQQLLHELMNHINDSEGE